MSSSKKAQSASENSKSSTSSKSDAIASSPVVSKRPLEEEEPSEEEPEEEPSEEEPEEEPEAALLEPTRRVSLVLDSWYQPNFVPNPDEIYERIKNEVDLIDRENLPPFGIFGKESKPPRDKAFYGDVAPDGSFPVYRYEKGGKYPTVLPWTPTVRYLRDLIERETGQRCNHVVINLYRDGKDHIGYHKDKTRDFLEGTHVFTISLAAPRKFCIKDQHKQTVAEQMLAPGSLNKLGWETNKEHKHAILKSTRVKGERYGLTFRTMKRA